MLKAPGECRYIVATMRSEEYAKFSGRLSLGPEGAGRDSLRQGWDVLRLATRVEVPRLWSAEEIARARQMTADPRLGEAVQHAREYGVAEYIAAAPQLLAEWRDAWAPGTHLRAAAMVLAAVDARRAGDHRPLPLAILRQLHEPYLHRRGGARLRPEDFEAALAWATTPPFATSSLLMPADGGYLAFDYLIDSVDRDRVPAEALDALITVATLAEALDIGDLAKDWSLTRQADTAYQQAEASGLFDATARRSYIIGDSLSEAAALRFAEKAAEWTAAVLGHDHLQTLQARSLVAWQTGFNGAPATAVSLLRDLAAHAKRVLGPEHEETMNQRVGIAAMTGHQGDLAGAAQQYEELVADCSRMLGEDHKMTISCRDQAALWTSDAGDPRRAAQMLTSLLEDMTERFRSRGDEFSDVRCMLADCLARADEYEQALRAWSDIVTEATQTYGQLHALSLYVREQQAWCIGEVGDAAQAVQLLTQLTSDLADLGNPGLLRLLFTRRSLAWWTGEAGVPQAAKQQLLAFAEEATAQRGAEDLRVKTVRLMLSYWSALNGPAETMRDKLEPVVAQITREFGPGHEVTRASRRQLARLYRT